VSTYNIGNVSGSGNAFGDHNTLVNNLEEQFRSHYGQLPDPRTAGDAIESLKMELAQTRPRRERVVELLGVITASAVGVSAVMNAVEGVRAALS
jgi:hypothetical protein